MLVRYWMTETPVTIKKTATLFQLLEYIKQYKARRFPVVDEGKLTGIVSISDLYRIVSPRATRANVLPQKYKDKLSRHDVSQIMIQNPLVCSPNDHLEDIARLMRKNKIGALPVLKKDKLVGIITESDVLEALIEISGGSVRSRRISLKVAKDKKTQEFYDIVDLCKHHSVDILTILTHSCNDSDMLLITLRVSGKNIKDLVDALWKSHHQVLIVE